MEAIYALIFLGVIITFGFLICKFDDNSRKTKQKRKIDKSIRELQSIYNVTEGKQMTVKEGKVIIK